MCGLRKVEMLRLSERRVDGEHGKYIYGVNIMNKAIIESVEWHKDQLFKLLEDDDLYKIEGDIHSVKSDLNEIIEKAKKKVWVKVTSTRKGHYRMQETGKKVEEKEGKKISVSDDMREEISEIKKEYDIDKVAITFTTTQEMINHTYFESFLKQTKSAGLDIDKSSLKPIDDPREQYDRLYYTGKTDKGEDVAVIQIGPGAFGVSYNYFTLVSKYSMDQERLVMIGDRLNKAW